MRYLVLALLTLSISCSDKDKNNPPLSHTPADQTETPTSPEKLEDEESQSSTPTVITEEFLDTEIAVLTQEIKNQLESDPLSGEKKSRNVLLANRIYKINFSHGNKSSLSFVTHSKMAYKFNQTGTQGNTQYFQSFEKAKSPAYKAEAKIVKSTSEKKIIILKITETTTEATVHVFYVIKNGTLRPVYTKNVDYAENLSKTSKVFIQRLIERPQVRGEFYGVITEDDNYSLASRFVLTISNNFMLESLPLMGQAYNPDHHIQIPLIVESAHFWKTACGVLCGGGVSYSAAKDFTYLVETPRNPVELKALNIDLKLEALEKIDGKVGSLPLKLFVRFK